jgi:hypothetical protein
MPFGGSEASLEWLSEGDDLELDEDFGGVNSSLEIYYALHQTNLL